MQLFELEVGKITMAAVGEFDRLRDCFVRLAKGQAFLNQVVRQIGGRGKTLKGGPAHGCYVDLDAADHVGKHAQARSQGVDGVEQRLLVFLVVLVISQRLAFHQC